MNITVIGGMNTDVVGTPSGTLRLRDSNIGRIALSAGGVGRNIAENLVRLGHSVELITALGEDWFTDTLRAHCATRRIGLAHSPVISGVGSGVYLCLNDDARDMYVAVNDMSAIMRLTPELIDMAYVNFCDALVLDTNAPRETLEYIALNATVPIFADPVSAAKAGRLSRVLDRLCAIKPNLAEAQMLTGQNTPEDCARALVALGVKYAYVSLGDEGMAWADEADYGTITVSRLDPVCTTGAGDAATAALCAGYLLGLDAKNCAYCACKASALTVMSTDAVSEKLTPETVFAGKLGR